MGFPTILIQTYFKNSHFGTFLERGNRTNFWVGQEFEIGDNHDKYQFESI